MKNFTKALSILFLVALLGFVWPVNQILSWTLTKLTHPVSGGSNCVSDFDRPYLVNARSPVQAKSNHVLWADFLGVRHCGKDGLGFDILNHADRFLDIFPGYESVLSSKDMFFWRRYFSRVFNFDVWPADQPFANPIRFSLSWQGNADIFRRYGADILVIGSSQTFRQIIPKKLADNLAGFWKKKYENQPKTLMLTVSDMQTDTVNFMVDKLQNVSGKAKLAIFGYTPKMAFLNRPGLSKLNQSRRNEWQNDVFRTKWEIKEYVPYLDWKAVFPVDMFDIKNSLRPGATGLPVFKASDLANDGTRVVKEYLVNYQPAKGTVFFSEFETFHPHDCAIQPILDDLKKTVGSLLKISDRVFLYAPPASEVSMLAYPGCFDEAIKTAMLSVASSRVFVSTEGWRDYGLDNQDYLWPNAGDLNYLYDPIHTNYKGAIKVTEKISHLILGVLE